MRSNGDLQGDPTDESGLILSGHFGSAGDQRWARTIPLRGLFNINACFLPHLLNSTANPDSIGHVVEFHLAEWRLAIRTGFQ
jgi:hypothetical protein